jgi:NADPH:quinone reductase-like Zn-dependent oxidoreductase
LEKAVMRSLRIIVRRFGGPEVLETAQEEAREPGRGEVRVREFAAGVSFADLLMREGIHPEKTTLPFTPGWDIVGVVEKNGEGASDCFPPGKTALRGGGGSGWVQASVQATVFAAVLETVPWRELR